MKTLNTHHITQAQKRRARRGSAALITALVAFAALPAAPARAADPAVDGKTSETAAASCWEIKQNDPQSASGTYWLYTPQMPAPAQFYCDQTTDGGGWVMVGRGRENWKETYAGTGAASDLTKNPTGPSAFKTAQLPSQTIDALMNGSAPEDLSDGIRLRRSLNSGGTDWQEVRFNREYSPQWSWTFGSETPVTGYSFTNYRNGASCDTWGRSCRTLYDANYSTQRAGTASIENFGGNNSRGYNRVIFNRDAAQGYVAGFGYDQGVRAPALSASVGDNPNSYLWSKTYGYAQPFTQMYLKPKVTQSDLNLLRPNASGVVEGSQRRPLPNSYAERTTWGATGRANGNTNEMNTEVQSFAQVGNTMFMGGNFARLQTDSAGSQTFDQSYVAGMDVDTAQPVPGFRPRVNGQIKTMHAVDGKLAIGGEFTEVNGEERDGFAVLDPETGELDPAWDGVSLTNNVSGGTVQVKAMDVQNGYLYLAGSFTHVDSPGARTVYARGGTRIRLDTMTADRAWNPNFNGTVNGLSASRDGTKVFAAGYFSQAKGTDAFRLASLNTTDGSQNAPWNWEPSYQPAYPTGMWGFQFAVKDTDDGNVWVAGTEHILHTYDSSTLARKYSSIARNGGDFQSISTANGNVYGSCHCGDYAYQGAKYYNQNESSWAIAHQLSLIGAWDQRTGAILPEFNPQLKGPGGYGVWGSATDSNGTLWAGGSIDRSTNRSGTAQWSGGFVRFAARDVQAPATPGGLTATSNGATDRLTWRSVGSGATYQIIRNNKVIGSTTSTSAEFTHRDGATYYVRAMDAAQNFSTSSPGVRTGQAMNVPAARQEN